MGAEDQYRQDYKCAGLKLWNYIRTAINFTTTTGASGYKDEIGSKTLDDFDHNVKNYNTWFKNTRSKIVTSEGKGNVMNTLVQFSKRT